MMIGEEHLDADGTFEALTEVQGRFLPHGRKAEEENFNSLVVMRPRKLKIGSEDVVTWAIGHRPGQRTLTDYDSQSQEIKQAVQKDTHILYTSMIAVPRIGALAVNDRVNAMNMGAKPALSRTRSVFRHMDEGSFAFWFLKPGDVAAVVDKLDLSEYAYTVRRINPTPPSVLAAALDSSMAREGIGIDRGVAKPLPGETMHSDGGFIEATTDLAGAGYAVLGFKGTTEEGRLAQIKKPPFSLDKKENLRQMEKETPLRVFFESDNEDDALLASVVAELVRFYDGDDSTDLPQESS
jgi:hypothetical protein